MTSAIHTAEDGGAARPFDALVLDGRLRQSLVTVRSLGRRGLSVAVMEAGEDVPAFRSRWCRRALSSGEAGADGYVARLEHALETTGARVVIPSHDGTIALLRLQAPRLQGRARIALAEEGATSIAVSKVRTLAVAERLGLRVPHRLALSDAGEVESALREVGLPAVVKPSESCPPGAPPGTRLVCQLVTTPAESVAAVRELTRFGGVVLFQRLLPGRREAVSFLYANGEVHARFAQWAKRTAPPLGGESVLRQSIAVPRDIGAAAERLVREIGLEGYSEVEFRRDAAGEPCLMEINPRLSASVEIAVRSGVDFPYLLYQWAQGGRIDRVQGYREGVWMRYLRGDLMGTIATVRERGRPGVTPPARAVAAFGLSCLTPMAYDYLDWTDPRPALEAAASFTRAAVRAAVDRKGKAAPSAGDGAATAPATSAAARYDAVVVGAGPYGLSAAAHLLGRGLETAVFGRTLELWRDHMPAGMRLRSHAWATNLSDPRGRYGFERFLGESGYGTSYPIPRQAFLDYGRWFQEQAVPCVDETYVETVERAHGQFLLTLADGRQVQSAAVVMAVGLGHYAHRPPPFDRLPAALCSHSSDLSDLSRFAGKTVVVVGGGQSAIEYAALLNEAGAVVHVVARRPVLWLSRDRSDERSLLERLRAPRASIGPGWVNFALDRAPYLFYRLSAEKKARALRVYYAATAAQWLRERVVGKATLHEECTIAAVAEVGGVAQATLSDGTRIEADHVVVATGYKVDVRRLRMIHPSLRAEIETEGGGGAAPVLSHGFESTAGGLYFVGLTSLHAFGPLFRFVAGCGAAARRVSSAVARRAAPRPSFLPRPSPRPILGSSPSSGQ